MTWVYTQSYVLSIISLLWVTDCTRSERQPTTSFPSLEFVCTLECRIVPSVWNKTLNVSISPLRLQLFIVFLLYTPRHSRYYTSLPPNWTRAWPLPHYGSRLETSFQETIRLTTPSRESSTLPSILSGRLTPCVHDFPRFLPGILCSYHSTPTLTPTLFDVFNHLWNPWSTRYRLFRLPHTLDTTSARCRLL